MSTLNKGTSRSNNSMLRAQGLDNMELFYNQQIMQEGRSWELSIGSGEDYFSVRGLLTGINLDFTINNEFGNDLSQSNLAQVFNKFNGVWDKVRQNYPTVKIARSLGKSLGDDISNLMTDGKFDFLRNAANSVTDSLSELSKDMLSGLSKLTELAPNTFDTLGIRDPDEKFKERGITDAKFLAKIISPFEETATFGGTNVSVPTGTLKAYVFHRRQADGSSTNVKDFITKCIDKTAGVTLENESKTKGGVIGLQAPPNNYVPNLAGLGQMSKSESPGTWTLRLGPLKYYNVLVRNFNFSLGKYRALENWTSETTSVVSRDPFMATLNFNIMFANKLLAEDIKRILASY